MTRPVLLRKEQHHRGECTRSLAPSLSSHYIVSGEFSLQNPLSVAMSGALALKCSAMGQKAQAGWDEAENRRLLDEATVRVREVGPEPHVVRGSCGDLAAAYVLRWENRFRDSLTALHLELDLVEESRVRG